MLKNIGCVPELTEAQRQEVAKLSEKLYDRAPSKKSASSAGYGTGAEGEQEPEDALLFDINKDFSGTHPVQRALLFQTIASKKSLHSIVTQHSKRKLFLFNDVLLVTSIHMSSSFLNKTEKYCIRQVRCATC